VSASTGEKIIAVLAFVVIGLPAGLCSIGLPAGFIISGSRILSLPVNEIFNAIVPMLVTWLFSVTIAGFLLWWVVRSFRSTKVPRNDHEANP